MALQLTFGGTTCPFKWGVISKTICDLMTAIILNDKWNPSSYLHASNQEKYPLPKFLPDDIPFAKGCELAVDVQINDRGTHDIYIDDLVSLPNSNSRSQSEAEPLLAINTCSRQFHDNEPIPHHNIAALHKLWTEGRLEETKMILRWLWDFQWLTNFLPTKEFTAWASDITQQLRPH